LVENQFATAGRTRSRARSLLTEPCQQRLDPDAIRSVERVYELSDAAFGAKGVAAAAALSAEGTRLESPPVRYLLG
jgi:hypothetical protein